MMITAQSDHRHSPPRYYSERVRAKLGLSGAFGFVGLWTGVLIFFIPFAWVGGWASLVVPLVGILATWKVVTRPSAVVDVYSSHIAVVTTDRRGFDLPWEHVARVLVFEDGSSYDLKDMKVATDARVAVGIPCVSLMTSDNRWYLFSSNAPLDLAEAINRARLEIQSV